MENLNPNFFTAPPYSSLRQDGFDSTWNEQFASFSFGADSANTNQPNTSLYNFSDGFQGDETACKGLLYQPISQVRPSARVNMNPSANVSKSSRQVESGKTRKSRTKPAPTSKLGQEAKRQKMAAPELEDAENTRQERCDSISGSQSECCSSCPDSPPCDESSCCGEADCGPNVVLVPCSDKSCEKPVCSNPCLSAGIRSKESTLEPPISKTTNWLEGSWGQSRDMANIVPVVLASFDSQHASTSASPAPTTPSFGQNIDTPYSPATVDSRNLNGAYGQYEGETSRYLLSAGNSFNPQEWHGYASETNNNSHGGKGVSYDQEIRDDATLLPLNCHWNGCNSQDFMNEQQWLSHLHNSHIDPQLTFGCPVQGEMCPQTVITNPVDHLQMDHGFNFDMSGNTFSCPAPACVPSEMFFTPTTFHNHFDHVHGVPAQGSLHCRLDTCNTTFVDPQDLMVHIKEHHKLPISLPKDDDIDNTLSAQTASILASLPKAGLKKAESTSATSALDTVTDFQEKGFVSSCKWMASHSGEVCGYVSISEEDLQKHIKNDHLAQLDKSSGYKCQWEGCNRDSRRGEKSGFSQRGKLERHMATHTGFKCCSCEICGRTFSAEQSLRQHILLHNGEKPWKCKHCGKGFPQQSACTIHERTHTKEKPLECNICGKRFSESSNLSKHRKIHGEKGANICDHPGCGKSFHRLDQLKRHRLMHDRQAARLKEKSVDLSEEGGTA